MWILFFIFLAFTIIFLYAVDHTKELGGLFYIPLVIFCGAISLFILGYNVISLIVSHITIIIN